MKVKVCGLRRPSNIRKLAKLDVDYLGFIFANRSPRKLINMDNVDLMIRQIHTPKVGVFVNADLDFIQTKVRRYQLDFVQLHGDESPQFVAEVGELCSVIKVFKLESGFDFQRTADYSAADFFLFDTKGKYAGGNGTKFDWSVLEKYGGSTRFMLSGGIHLADVFDIRRIEHPQLLGVDINSGFEISPGDKNIEVIRKFVEELKQEESYAD